MLSPTSGGEYTNSEKMEALCESIRSWCTEEEDAIPFPYWKGVDEEQEPVEPTLLSANSAVVFTEVESLLNSHVERTVIFNDITQGNNRVLGDKRN